MILWHREPSLNEMLSDPLIKTLMRADGVDPEKLGSALRTIARSRMRPPSVPQTAALCAA